VVSIDRCFAVALSRALRCGNVIFILFSSPKEEPDAAASTGETGGSNPGLPAGNRPPPTGSNRKCEGEDCNNGVTKTSDGNCVFCAACCADDACTAKIHVTVRGQRAPKTSDGDEAAGASASSDRSDGRGSSTDADKGSTPPKSATASAAPDATAAHLATVASVTLKLAEQVAALASAPPSSASAAASNTTSSTGEGITAKSLFLTPSEYLAHPVRLGATDISDFMALIKGASVGTLRLERRLAEHSLKFGSLTKAQRRSAFKEAGAWDPDEDDAGLQSLFTDTATDTTPMQALRATAGDCATLRVLLAAEAAATTAVAAGASAPPSGAAAGGVAAAARAARATFDDDDASSPASSTASSSPPPSIPADYLRAGTAGTVPLSKLVGERITTAFERKGLRTRHSCLEEFDAERAGAATLYVRFNAAKGRRYAMRSVPRCARILIGSYRAHQRKQRPPTWVPPGVHEALAEPWVVWPVRDTKDELDLLGFVVWLGFLTYVHEACEVLEVEFNKKAQSALASLKASVSGWIRKWELDILNSPANRDSLKLLNETAHGSAAVARMTKTRGGRHQGASRDGNGSGDGKDRGTTLSGGKDRNRDRRDGTGNKTDAPDAKRQRTTGDTATRYTRCHAIKADGTACPHAPPKYLLERFGGSKDPICRSHRDEFETKLDSDGKTAFINRARAKYPNVTIAEGQ